MWNNNFKYKTEKHCLIFENINLFLPLPTPLYQPAFANSDENRITTQEGQCSLTPNSLNHK